MTQTFSFTSQPYLSLPTSFLFTPSLLCLSRAQLFIFIQCHWGHVIVTKKRHTQAYICFIVYFCILFSTDSLKYKSDFSMNIRIYFYQLVHIFSRIIKIYPYKIKCMCAYISIHTYINQKLYFNLLAKNRFKVYHYMLVSKLRIFACHYFRWLEFRVSRSPGWVGGTHLLSKFSGACWAPPRASLPTSPSASHHSQSCHAMQWWPRWHLLCLQILHSPHFFQPQDKHLSIVQNDWGGGKKKRKSNLYIFLQHFQSEVCMIC